MSALRDCVPSVVSFRDMFIAQKQEDEESADLGEALEALDEAWPREIKFRAAHVADLINNPGDGTYGPRTKRGAIIRDFLFPKPPPSNQPVSAKAVGKRLMHHLGDPVHRGQRTLVLKEFHNPGSPAKDAISYFVHSL
jgi:hypothetical protein